MNRRNPAPTRPDWHFALRDPLHFLALGCGSGLSPVAPGTAGTLFAWLSYAALVQVLPAWAWPWLLILAAAGGVAVCGYAARALGVDDPSAVVWDEIAAFWLVLWILDEASRRSGLAGAAPWWLQAAGFALFRVFDAVKRGPVGWADRRFKGGLGIMLDDFVAALLTLLVVGTAGALWLGLAAHAGTGGR